MKVGEQLLKLALPPLPPLHPPTTPHTDTHLGVCRRGGDAATKRLREGLRIGGHRGQASIGSWGVALALAQAAATPQRLGVGGGDRGGLVI